MSQFLKIENPADWEKLFSRVRFATFFHHPGWEKFLEKNFPWLNFEHYLYDQEAILSLARVKFWGKEKLISHPFCEYGGPLPLTEKIDGRIFTEALFGKFQNEVKISFHPGILEFFQSANVTGSDPVTLRSTYFIEELDRKTPEQIWSAFRKTLRHAINKASNLGVEIKKCDSAIELKDLYHLHLKTARRHRALPYPFSFFEYFGKSPDAEIVVAKLRGKVLAGSLFLFYGPFIHYFLNATDRAGRDSFASHLILWHQLKKYAGKNFKVFDLGGTATGSKLAIFKEGWGARRYPIFELKNYQGGNRFKSSKLRIILGLLPDFLLASVSPYLLKYKLFSI